ncbi:helitron helicase-like domain-containing protein [Artemisia annua]|uniref:Helitron helicase-like domain-containing protein n=1 Tax=Artemisia annua TaxID=35608 RepID=A0A2U1N2V5_ARTAN|nr:helitron helicase-like domain-containing protein [Artemisia annua]
MDRHYSRPKSANQNKNNHSYLNNQCAIHLSPLQQTSSLESESDTQFHQSKTPCAARKVVRGCRPTKKQKTPTNGPTEYALPLQQQQPFQQYEPTVTYKQGYHFTHDDRNHSPAPANGSAFETNKKQKGLLSANDDYNTDGTFCAPPPVLYNEGSSHREESHRIQTPYDRWTCIPEDALPNDKQGFFTQGGKPVCLKCLNVGPNSIFSWEGTTICMRCMNTQNPNSSYITQEGLMNNIYTKSPATYTSGTSQNRQSERQNADVYDEGVHDPKGKGIAYESNIHQHQRVYYSSQSTTPSLNITGSGTPTTQGKHECARRSKKRTLNQIGGGQQLYNQQNAYSEDTLTSTNSRDTEGVSDLYIDLGDCQCVCEYCNATFWYGERLKSHSHRPRDKCEEANVPKFKIQLYNVVASREHQLPSSETLGAIVFQPDTNSQTDFDMIIEYKDKQPKRINKLHSSYMSLQFPLLFAYGQPGYNTGLTLKGVNATRKRTKVSMNMYYKYQLHERVDYIGCYISSGEKQKWGNPNKNQMVNRKIEIQNLNRNSIELTLWDDLAQTFKKQEIDALEKPVIIAVTSCRVSRYRNKLQLESTPATYYYINPKIPELEQYRTEYRALFDINPPLRIVRHPYQDKEQEKMRNRIPLNMLLKESPQSHAGVRFTCDGVITAINTLREWYYPSCKECNTKAENNGGTFDCKTHSLLDSPLYRSLENPNPKQIPEELESIVGRKHIFQFHFNTTSKQKPPDFVFNQILDKPNLPKQIEGTPSASKTTENPQDAIEYESTSAATPSLSIVQTSLTHQAEHEGTNSFITKKIRLYKTIFISSILSNVISDTHIGTSATGPGLSIVQPSPNQEPQDKGTTEETNIMASPQNIISTTDTETAIATPPTPHTGMQTRSKTDDAARKAIKRPLFPEEAPDNKKKKT